MPPGQRAGRKRFVDISQLRVFDRAGIFGTCVDGDPGCTLCADAILGKHVRMINRHNGNVQPGGTRGSTTICRALLSRCWSVSTHTPVIYGKSTERR